MNHLTKVSLILFIILIVGAFDSHYRHRIEGFVDVTHGNLEDAPMVSFPFKNIRVGDTKRNTNVIAIVAPFRNSDHQRQFEHLKNLNYKFVGISSYLQFPGIIKNQHDPALDKNLGWYIDQCIAWIHCFRKPNLVFSELKWRDLPLLQMAQSDFTNPLLVKPDHKIPKKWDFIYICLKDNDQCEPGWNSINRNWELAKKCFKILCGKYKLKGLIIGRQGCSIDPVIQPYLTIKPQLKYWEFIQSLQASRFTFLPNIMDASPRILTESLCVNIPVLVNVNIVGGWKYVNSQTGEFFQDENDLESAYIRLHNNYSQYRPREFFRAHYGPKISGKRLSKFLRTVYPLFTPCEEAVPYCCD